MKFGLLFELQLPKPIGADWDDRAEYRLIQEALEQTELADSLGFDYVFAVEHHFLEEFSHSSAPEVFLAACAQRTRRIRIGHGAMVTVPRINHPARCAERIGMLDLVSGGRVEFGMAESATMTELAGFGVARDKKREMMHEGSREICRMMTETPYPGHRGDYFSMPARNVVPKPLQKPHPPLWMAASSAEACFAAARMGLGAYAFSLETPEELAARVDEYYRLIREECTPMGLAINPAIASFFPMSCYEDESEAIETGVEAQKFFSYAVGHHYGSEHPHGRDNLYTRFKQLPEETSKKMAQSARRAGCIGTPAQIRETLLAHEREHLDLMAFIVQAGGRAHEDVMHSIRLFATQVMPEFQARHTAHQAWRAEQLRGVPHLINSSI